MANKISFKKLPQQRHADFLDDMEKMADLAFSDVLEAMVSELFDLLKQKKLAKSENLIKGLAGDWQKEGYTLTHQKQNDLSTITAHTKDGEVAGMYSFNHHPHHLEADDAWTDIDHRRKGLASAAYQLIESKTRKKIKSMPHRMQPDGEALWAQPNRPFGKSLAKSDDKLPRGWTGEVPKIEVDFDKLFAKSINKYMNALKYILLGKAAGPEAEEAAEATGATKNAIPGMIQSAYLDSIDTHRQYYDMLFDKSARTIPKELIKETLKAIDKKTSRFMDESLQRLSNKVVTAVEMEAERLRNSNINEVSETRSETTEIKDKLTGATIMTVVREAGESYRSDWSRMVSMDLTLASAVGTHQVVQEIYSGSDGDVKVAWVAMRDEKTCEFCKNASRYTDGTFKLYGINEFEPAGYNYGKKRGEWKLCIPGAHPNCRCSLIYIPTGFEVTKDGTVQPLKKK